MLSIMSVCSALNYCRVRYRKHTLMQGSCRNHDMVHVNIHIYRTFPAPFSAQILFNKKWFMLREQTIVTHMVTRLET